MAEPYILSYWGIFLSLLTLVVQGAVAAGSKASQPNAVPGKIDEKLSHDSFVFRSHRTFMNSLENMPAFLGASLLAIISGASAFWTGILVMIYAMARIVHMMLYYMVATERNPSPRSWFFIIGFLANLALLVVCGLNLAVI